MKLTKRERKYRQKIICEHKYNKENQKILDVYVKKSRWWNTYYKLYKSITGFVFITRVINDKEESERAFKSLKEFLMPIKDDSGNIKSLYDIFGDIAKRWTDVTITK